MADEKLEEMEQEMDFQKENEEVIKSEKVIEIKESKLESLLDRLKRLEYAANKSQLAHFDNKLKKDFSKTCTVSTYDDKLVMVWGMTEDIVEKINGAWMERQSIKLTFEDGTDETMPYDQFVKRRGRKEFKMLSETRTAEGDTIWDAESVEEGFDDPIALKINIKFINF